MGNTMSKARPTQTSELMNAKVTALRELLTAAKDLGEISDYFHDVLVPDDAFMTCGEASSEPRLRLALQAVLERVAPAGKLGKPMFVRLHEQRLCHGYTTWGSGHVVFFFFEQLDLGFCSYSPSLTSEQILFARFNLTNAASADSWGTWQSSRAPAPKTMQ